MGISLVAVSGDSLAPRGLIPRTFWQSAHAILPLDVVDKGQPPARGVGAFHDAPLSSYRPNHCWHCLAGTRRQEPLRRPQGTSVLLIRFPRRKTTTRRRLLA
jgi:hypothetical protein